MEKLNEGKSNVGQPIDRATNLKLIGDVLLKNKAKAGAGKNNAKSTLNNHPALKNKVNKNQKLFNRKSQ